MIVGVDQAAQLGDFVLEAKFHPLETLKADHVCTFCVQLDNFFIQGPVIRFEPGQLNLQSPNAFVKTETAAVHSRISLVKLPDEQTRLVNLFSVWIKALFFRRGKNSPVGRVISLLSIRDEIDSSCFALSPYNRRSETMSLQSHLQALSARHKSLDEALQEELKRPSGDALAMTRMKREKLKLKEEINSLKTEVSH